MVNYIITDKYVLPVDSKCSETEHYISKEDFDILVTDRVVREELLRSLNKDNLIVSIKGYDVDGNGVYVKEDSKIIKVGEVKW